MMYQLANDFRIRFAKWDCAIDFSQKLAPIWRTSRHISEAFCLVDSIPAYCQCPPWAHINERWTRRLKTMQLLFASRIRFWDDCWHKASRFFPRRNWMYRSSFFCGLPFHRVPRFTKRWNIIHISIWDAFVFQMRRRMRRRNLIKIFFHAGLIIISNYLCLYFTFLSLSNGACVRLTIESEPETVHRVSTIPFMRLIHVSQIFWWMLSLHVRREIECFERTFCGSLIGCAKMFWLNQRESNQLAANEKVSCLLSEVSDGESY